MKKLVGCLMALLCLLTFASAEDEWSWNLLEDKTVEILEYRGSEERKEEVTVPAEFDGYKVTVIGPYAFMKHSYLKRIILPETVTVIGESAFGECLSLEKMDLPEGLKVIGGFAFADCDALTGITLPANAVIEGGNPFVGCDLLTDIQVSPENPALEVVDSVLFDKVDKRLICYPFAREEDSYVVPDGVLAIGQSAFCGSGLKRITLPDSLTALDSDAFIDCDGLTSIALPDGVTVSSLNPFTACDNLTDILLSPEHPALGVTDGVLYSKEDMCVIACLAGLKIESCEIPEGIRVIGAASFQDCSTLTSITLPSSLEVIEDYAFYCCEGLKSIVIPDGVTAINMCAFFKCSELTSAVIPASVTYMEDWAFILCNSLTLTVPRGSYAETWAQRNNVPYTCSGN